MTDPDARRLYPRKDAAHYLGISLRSLDLLGSQGLLLKVVICGRVTYDRRDMDLFIDRLKSRA